MKKLLLSALLAASTMAAGAQTFHFKGNIHTTEYDGLPIYLIKQDVVFRDQLEKIDSCTVHDGKYSFHVAAPDSAFMATIALPPKDNHFVYGLPEIACIVEDGTVEADCQGFAYTLKGGVLNQQYDDTYLAYDRQVKAETEKMMQQRAKAEQHRQFTDTENEAYGDRLRSLYDSIRPMLRNFIQQNITNKVGAHLFLTYPQDYWPAEFCQQMRQQVNPAYLQQAEARDKAAADAVAYAQVAHQNTTAGHAFRDFPSFTTDGTPVQFSQYVESGKVTLLDFWASWCAPCIQESKELKQLYEQYHAKGFNIVSVSLDSNKQKWLDAIERHQLPWTHISSVKGFKDPAATEYAVSAIPFVVLIDQQGNIALLNMHGPVLREKIKELMEK